MSDNILQVKALCKHFDNNKVLRGVSLDVNKGDVIAVIGPSGCGKSTFLRCLNLLETPSSGEIIFDGTSIYRLTSINTKEQIKQLKIQLNASTSDEEKEQLKEKLNQLTDLLKSQKKEEKARKMACSKIEKRLK